MGTTRIARGTFALSLLLLAGCGVTLEAQRIEPDALGPVIAGEGAVYALPRTGFAVLQKVQVSVPTGGALPGIFSGCSAQCKAGNNQDMPANDLASWDPAQNACAFKRAESSLIPTRPVVGRMTSVDLSRTYRVTTSADLLTTSNIQLELGNSGILTSASSSATNMGYEVASALAKAAVSMVPFLFPAQKFDLGLLEKGSRQEKPKPAPAADVCLQLQRSLAALAKANPNPKDGDPANIGILQCTQRTLIEQCLEKPAAALDALLVKREKLFDDALKYRQSPRLVEQKDAYLKAEIADTAQALDAARARLQLAPRGQTTATFQLETRMGYPEEHKPYEPAGTSVSTAIAAGSTTVTELSPGADKQLTALVKLIEQQKLSYDLKVGLPAGVNRASTVTHATSGGYRYRVPTLSPVTLVATRTEGTQAHTLTVREDLSVAQHGPIATLPSRFVGKGGKVVIKLWPETGGLQTVEIGSEAVPASAITGVIDKVEARVLEKRKADADAAKVDTEVVSLTREKDLLDLKLQILKLRKDLDEAGK